MNSLSLPLRFILYQSIALQQGVSYANANRAAVTGLILKPPMLGLLAALMVARNEPAATPPAPTQPVALLPGPKETVPTAPMHEHKGKGAHHHTS